MKACPHCGKEIAEEAESCPHCGEDLKDENKISSSEKRHWATRWAKILIRVSVYGIVFIFIGFIFLFVLRWEITGTILIYLATVVITLCFFLSIIVSIVIHVKKIEGMGYAVFCIGLGIIVLIVGAIPAFMSRPHPAKQSEAKIYLKEIFSKEQQYFTDHGSFAKSFQALDWKPKGRNRYAYFLPYEAIENQQGGTFKRPNIKPEAGATGFTAVAAGNIDSDPTLDVWTINDRGVLQNVINDVMQ